ncbi:hypothetical protein ATE47_11355 [Chryseobacterium sp. IHB B 17019]|jgi:aminoglycoside N3'-acetyltransferase|uniref:AAC(3) family N-acetyltransferase n=1 Tax=Chryseobacterium sp. IHB B 17019 TaxID=1721091 RepID=UPI000720A19C|nr:AAC(3) family N-acetyltransferase [Chryseobacterium sp. IHB B 17019]ALR31085.1 hypothetical protein ATE47_11355 [Chryseobacterium sp. IHB B 17019]
MISKETIIKDLKDLGLQEGDCVFLNSDLLRVGYLNKTKKKTLEDWIDIFKEVLGDKGTLVLPSYTATFFIWKKNRNVIFDRNFPTYAGAFPNFLIGKEEAYRSTHPTHSCIAIGFEAKDITSKHTEENLSYSILGEIVKRNGKFLLLGTIDKNNAPQGMHYAQELLGYTKKSPYKYLLQTFYRKKNKVSLFTKKDIGGCSRGGYNLYGELVVNNKINFGKVGNAESALMKAKESTELIKKKLQDKPTITQCDHKDCIDCYGSFYMNGLKIFPFYIKLIFSKIMTNGK